MVSNETMEGLVAMFSEDDEPSAAAELVEEAEAEEADEGAEEAAAEESETEPTDDEPDEDEAAGAEPKGAKYLSLLGPDGKPTRVHIDKLLADTVHDVQVDGERKFVSYQELRDGYQRQADYTRKTMDLAKERAELAPFAKMVSHAKADPDFVRHVQAYFQQGPNPQMQAAARLEVADEQLAQLLDSERKEDVAQAKQILQARAQLRRQLQQRQETEARTAEEQRRLLETYLSVEREKVTQAIPEYGKQAPAIAAALRDVYGFSEAELSGVYDSRLVRVAHDAMLYRKSLEDGSKLGLAGKRQHPLPPKAARPGTGKANSSAREIRRSKELTARAIKSGSTDDWATVIAQRLGL